MPKPITALFNMLKEVSLLLLTVILLVGTFASAKASEEYDFSWLDPDKKIFVVQNRKYEKKDRFSLGVSGGMNFGAPFNDTYGAFLRAEYFPFEVLGMQVLYYAGSSSKSSLFKDSTQVSQKPVLRELSKIMGAMVTWAPFYGKVNTFDQIVYFDWLFSAGLGRLTSSVDQEVFKNDSNGQQFTSPAVVEETYTAFLWDVGLRVYLNRQFSAQAEVFNAHYKAPGIIYSKERWFVDRLILLGMNYAF